MRFSMAPLAPVLNAAFLERETLMPKRYPMIEYMKRGPFDDIDTPEEALLPLIPYLPKQVWEPCPGRHVLAQHLAKHNICVIETFQDFLVAAWPNEACDAIVTNPPFSLKGKFIARCAAWNKPWALLLPVTTPGVRAAQIHLHDAEIIFLPKRIDFTGGKAPWFAVAWFTWGLKIGRQMTFAGPGDIGA